MKEFNQYYFAFGSNLDVNRIKGRNVKYIQRIPAILHDYKITFDKQVSGIPGETYANIQSEKDSIVEGAIYVTDLQGIERLDRAEGIHGNHYIRKEIDVIIKESQKKVRVWVYIAHPSKIVIGKPSKGYLQYILAGKDVFSESYYQNLTMVETI